MKTRIISHLPARRAGERLTLDSASVTEREVTELAKLGVHFTPSFIADAAAYYAAMDGVQAPVLAPNLGAPLQFLQTFLPGFVHTAVAARKIDALIGVSTVGAFEDEEIVQGVMEHVGRAVPYTDYGNVPLASYTNGYEKRTVVRFEHGMSVGKLDDMRAARQGIALSNERRAAAALALDIQRNAVGFYGYNADSIRCYGFLNDPNLPAYVNVSGSPWASKNFLGITADLRTAIAALATQSAGVIDVKRAPITLAVALSCETYLTVTSDFGISVQKWLSDTYPNIRVESAPELDGANGGANVFYLYAESVDDGSTDDRRTFDQLVPSRFMTVGSDTTAKSYLEDYANATAGVLCKRPYAVVRRSGI